MKKAKYTWIDALKEVLSELLVVVLFLGLCGIALIIGALLPKNILTGLPFELLIFLAVVAVLAVLYMISAIVTIISKIKSKMNTHKNDNN